MKTTQTDRSSRPPTRNSSADRGRTTETFWIRRRTTALLVGYFIMAVGVGCILELETHPSKPDAAPSKPAIATRTDLVRISARLPMDSLRPENPSPSSHE